MENKNTKQNEDNAQTAEGDSVETVVSSVNLREEFRDSLSPRNGVELLLMDSNKNYIVWLESKIARLRS
jgi:hypothetical protein